MAKHRIASILGSCLTVSLLAYTAEAAPLTPFISVTGTDWTQAGVSAVGAAGGGTITLSGISGTVTSAFLYWDGITVGSGIYNDPTVTLNGAPITGTAIGDNGSRSWGDGQSRVFRADVTPFVTSNGSYSFAGAADCSACDVNGASLIVTFNDGNSANNRDLYLFNGNDNNYAEGFPGESDGWHTIMAGIGYAGGSASLSLHVADGQSAADGVVAIAATPNVGGTNPVSIPDTDGRYDGASLPSAGNSRLEILGGIGDLWDIHTVDITNLFNGTTGTYALSLDGMDGVSDSLGLDVVIVDVASAQLASVPEPATFATLALGLAGLGVVRRRRR